MEFTSGLFLLRIGSLGSSVFLEFSRFRDEAVGNADNLPLCDVLARRGHIIDTLIQPRVEAFKWLVRIEGLLELPVVLRQVRCQYPDLVRVEVDKEGKCGGSGVSGERIIEGGEVCVLKFCE